jgi:hypothetical protein
MNENRIGMVSTSRSGCTIFRRDICNVYGMADSNSWLKKNDYKHIEQAPFSDKPHILKILIHYIPESELGFILNEMPKIWLYRDDEVRQFLSHVARLHTKINHVYEKSDQPILNDNSISATRNQFDIFMYRKKLFWKVWKAYGFLKNEPLIKFEDFLETPTEIIENLQEWYWKQFRFGGPFQIPMPHKIEMEYTEKFANYEEILEWFDE